MSHLPSHRIVVEDREEYEYLFNISVIMPVCNTERYLNDAFDSVIRQTIWFRQNIQLIVINDGSSDLSRSLCL